MRFVPGPDLPTGGKIVGLDGIRDAYETGRGTLPDAGHRPDRDGHRRAARASSSPSCPTASAPSRSSSRSRRWSRPRSCRASPTSRTSPTASTGLRLVIEVKNGFHPEAILEQLYQLTPMEDSFGINDVALVDGQPRTLGLKELLEVFLDHRFDVVRRRSTFRRGKARRPAAPRRGPAVAILDIDEVIQLIRSSDNAAHGPRAADRRSSTCRDPGRLHPRHAAAPADQVLAGIELEKEKDELRAHDRGARRDPRRREAAAEGRLRRARRGRQDLRHPAPHRPARVGRQPP